MTHHISHLGTDFAGCWPTHILYVRMCARVCVCVYISIMSCVCVLTGSCSVLNFPCSQPAPRKHFPPSSLASVRPSVFPSALSTDRLHNAAFHRYTSTRLHLFPRVHSSLLSLHENILFLKLGVFCNLDYFALVSISKCHLFPPLLVLLPFMFKVSERSLMYRLRRLLALTTSSAFKLP